MEGSETVSFAAMLPTSRLDEQETLPDRLGKDVQRSAQSEGQASSANSVLREETHQLACECSHS